jgi:hypothetical protein
MMSHKNTIAIFLILFGISAGILKITQKNDPVDNNIAILNIEKPSEDIIKLVLPISQKISDPTDRAKLAIFNQEFSSRIESYELDNQKLNDLYVLAADKFFKGSMQDKYEALDDNLKNLFISIITEDNHQITNEEKTNLKNTFSGLAWTLIQKK